MKYFDSHCHPYFPQFDADRAAVLACMQELEVGGVVVGTDLGTSKAAIELAASHDFLWASVGLHPNDPSTSSGQAVGEFDTAAYEALAHNPKVVAIGECGLDYFRSGGTEEEKEKQKQRFEKQIKLALKLKKPLIIHCRDPLRLVEGEASAHEDMLKTLFAYSRELANKDLVVVMHFFTGSAELAQKYLALGCYLSFPGPITYTDMYDESVRVTPLEKILAETDSPFAAPVPHRGQRNEPAYVVDVVAKLAALKGISAEEMAAHTVTNAQTFFNLPAVPAHAGQAGLQ